MKFDPLAWSEYSPGEKIRIEKGTLQLRATKQVSLLAAIEGCEALVGHGTSFVVTFSEPVEIECAGEGARIFILDAGSTSRPPMREVFTNADRLPMESGMMAEVQRARRMFEIEKRQMIAAIRTEANIARSSIRARGVTPQAPVADPEPAPAGDDPKPPKAKEAPADASAPASK